MVACIYIGCICELCNWTSCIPLRVVDPRKTSPGHYGGVENNERSRLVSNGILPPHSIWKDSGMAARSVMKVRTFQIIFLQGIGSLPWAVVVFFTMWFELIGWCLVLNCRSADGQW